MWRNSKSPVHSNFCLKTSYHLKNNLYGLFRFNISNSNFHQRNLRFGKACHHCSFSFLDSFFVLSFGFIFFFHNSFNNHILVLNSESRNDKGRVCWNGIMDFERLVERIVISLSAFNFSEVVIDLSWIVSRLHGQGATGVVLGNKVADRSSRKFKRCWLVLHA